MEKLYDKLKSLKNIGASAVKFELESEYLKEDLLKDISTVVRGEGLKFVVKLGGATSFADLVLCDEIKADAVVAPMLESPYALRKSVETFEKIFSKTMCDSKPDFYINIETKYAFLFLEEIFAMPSMEVVSGVVFGRSDMAASLGFDSVEANQDKLLDYANVLSKYCSSLNKKLVVGGNINTATFDFLKSLSRLDFYETRKVIFECGNLVQENFAKKIRAALEFELDWLEYKKTRGLGYDGERVNHIAKFLNAAVRK